MASHNKLRDGHVDTEAIWRRIKKSNHFRLKKKSFGPKQRSRRKNRPTETNVSFCWQNSVSLCWSKCLRSKNLATGTHRRLPRRVNEFPFPFNFLLLYPFFLLSRSFLSNVFLPPNLLSCLILMWRGFFPGRSSDSVLLQPRCHQFVRLGNRFRSKNQCIGSGESIHDWLTRDNYFELTP